MSPFWRRGRRDADETLVAERRAPAEREEVVEEEVEPAPPPPPRIWPWLLALLLLVLAGAVAYVLLTRDDERTVMPRVVGMTEGQARARLAAEELEVDVDRRLSDRRRGIVFAQTPGAGTQLDEGQRVEILVSSGRRQRVVPAVRDLPVEEAVEKIEEAGFDAEIQRVFAGAPRGRVVEQEPRGGERAPVGSEVLLKVSRGRNLNEVPDVVGRPEAEAVRILGEREFTVRIFDVPSSEARGTVVAQDPPAGEQAPPDSRVRINVSTGQTTGEEREREAPTPAQAQAQVPDVAGLAQTPALRRLQNAGLRGVVVYVRSDQPAGRVIEQRPEGGTAAARGTQVRLAVSAGSGAVQTTPVPDVVGEDEETARQILEDAGFRVEVIRTGGGNVVEDQQPAGGTSAPERAVVTIFVG